MEQGISAVLNMDNSDQKQGNITGTRNLNDNLSDLRAQVAANQKGIVLMTQLIKQYSLEVVQAYMFHIQHSAELAVRDMLCVLSQKQGLDTLGSLEALDYMDDGTKIQLKITIDRKDGSAVFDFTGTGKEVYGNTNAPKAVTYSAIIYCLRCLVKQDIPLNQGCLAPVNIIIPEGCFLNPSATAAVVGGNVLTSQRVTDVVLKAFKACAASQGCMNNFTFGDSKFGYYETIAGGAGAGPTWIGQSGVHTHMTNTRITDVEILERRYPVHVNEFSLRAASGGEGKYNGGDGVVRDLVFLAPVSVGILSERRSFQPYGMDGGEPGSRGENYIICKDGKTLSFGAKNTFQATTGDRIRILTPGGGGWGSKTEQVVTSKVQTMTASSLSKSAGSIGMAVQAAEQV
jgi:5-oxoprolinase (ATP-hydrolysing)